MSVQMQDLFVVLVEPSSTQRKIVANYFDQLGLNQIEHFQSASDALAFSKKSPPDLLISSLYLPDMTGTELLLEIRAEESLNDTAFMLISSETRFRYLEPVRQSGATAILPKPFTLDELKVALGATIDHLSNQQLDLKDFEPENLRVMVVDDSPMARRYIRRTLENMGIGRFAEAENGSEAVSMIAENFFDLIVTDYNMPQMDGKELIEHIRTASSQSSIPILMVTSEQDQSRLAAVQQAGVSAICDKPFETANVRHLLQSLLDCD